MNASLENIILPELSKRFNQYRVLGEQTLQQLNEQELHYQPNDNANSISIIIQHMHGNMMSRFTDFLTTDGEKDWRNRDEEFKKNNLSSTDILNKWNEGWNLLMDTINSLTTEDLTKYVTIRKEPLTVTDALFRQLAHYSYHVGQIIQIAKSLKNEGWQSLSIPVGQSQQYNQSDKIKDPANLYPPKKA